MTRIKLLVLGTMTTAMILGSSLVMAAPVGDDAGNDRAAAVADQVSSIGGGSGRYLPK